MPLIVKGQAQFVQPIFIQSFSLAGGSYYAPTEAALWLDWRLDLGSTVMELNQSADYFFTAGLLQPNISKWTTKISWTNMDAAFEIRYPGAGNQVMLYGKEPDLILHEIKIFDSNGHMVMNEIVKITSSFLAKPLQVSNLSNGIYYVMISYSPERHAINAFDNKRIKILKLVKT